MTVSGTASSGSTLVAAYEQLRSQAIRGATSGKHFGLILLLREGVAAWIARGRIDSVSVQSPADPNFCSASSALPAEIHAGIVGVLANMAMASRKEMSE